MTNGLLMKAWIRKEWRASLARSIWDDLTPFGRVIVWIPLWLLCWLTLPIILIIGIPLYFILRLFDDLPKFKPIIFK